MIRSDNLKLDTFRVVVAAPPPLKATGYRLNARKQRTLAEVERGSPPRRNGRPYAGRDDADQT